ncbi:hypothetical protein RD792_007702 [Penstemon davidsonii]|uniref:Cytochrome P450 n=1 Tax=Penstemon davidsonii TaxID=160366 RepID=A0ABR0D8Y1_9LAMI|nr:hypothetical protein RD792_007702 [Penstemon davidsonii]
MEYSSIFISLSLILPLIIFLLITKTKKSSKNLPPGSFGIPIIGQSLDILRAMRANKGEDWLQDRVRKYGPISRLNLFGTPTVFLHGHAANKFIYTCSEKILANQQPSSIRRLCGERNILELNGEDHKRVRGALVSFLKPEALRQSVGRIDEEIRLHFEKHWHGKHEIAVMPLMRTLTFDVICSLIFGIDRGTRRDTLVKLFEHLMEGMLAVPINLPFTRFNKSLHARAIFDVEQEEIARGKASSNELLTWEDLAKMKYTWRMATESMRINPPVFCSFRKVLEDIELGGYVIPSGWQVIWAGCMTHMDESIYPDPSKFDPSRFENQRGTPAYSFVAFGGGPRMCPGYEFARIETLTLIHYLVTGFQWKLSLQHNFLGRDPLPVFKQGLPIKIELKN